MTAGTFCCCGGLGMLGMLIGAGMGYLTRYLIMRVYPGALNTPGGRTLLLWTCCIIWAILATAVLFGILAITASNAAQ
jgi:hypothetical protein